MKSFVKCCGRDSFRRRIGSRFFEVNIFDIAVVFSPVW
jgi:hypothetical protein